LDTYIAAIRANMLTYSIWAGNYALVIAKQQRDRFAAAGWRKCNIRDYVFERARVTRREWRTVGKAAIAARQDEDRIYTALRTPDDLLVVAAGGAPGGVGAGGAPRDGAETLGGTPRGERGRRGAGGRGDGGQGARTP